MQAPFHATFRNVHGHPYLLSHAGRAANENCPTSQALRTVVLFHFFQPLSNAHSAHGLIRVTLDSDTAQVIQICLQERQGMLQQDLTAQAPKEARLLSTGSY